MLPAHARKNGVSFEAFIHNWNRGQGRETPILHREIAAWLERSWLNGEKRLLLLVFRDAGKSTLVGLFCAWLLVRDPDLRILILSAEGTLATKMSRNVRRILEQHEWAMDLLPARKEEWASDQFTVRRRQSHRDPSLLARGITANLTGARADIIICDDVEVPNTAATPGRRSELRERLKETAFILVPGGTQLFIGTPHHYYSIYAGEARPEVGEKAPFLDGYRRLVLPLLKDDGASRWPERFTPEAIDSLRRESGPMRFRSQMLLMPTHTSEVRLDPDRILRYAGELDLRHGNGESVLSIEGQRMAGAACFWDPAFGRPDGGDASVIAAVFTDENAGYWLHAIEYLTFDPKQLEETDAATQLCRLVAAFLSRHALPSITVESNGIGKFLPGLLRRELSRQGLGVAVRDETSTRAKDQRILDAFDPALAAGALHAHARVWDTPFIREMREWLPGGRGRDDGLDAVSGCILSQPVRLGLRPGPTQRQSWGAAPSTVAARTDFEI